jgi:hypothetical protein
MSKFNHTATCRRRSKETEELRMLELRVLLFVFVWLALAGGGSLARLRGEEPVVWRFERLDEVGGKKVALIGKPRIVEALSGKAIEFDGVADGLLVDMNPLAGIRQFTAEIIFRPDANGPKEQRFFHAQEDESTNRLLFETRLTDDNRWFLDTFIQSTDGGHTLFAEKSLHETGRWHHAAVVVDGREMRHYVNGQQEMATPIRYEPLRAGSTSIGVRQNRVSWFKGAVSQFRVTRRALEPREFLRVE